MIELRPYQLEAVESIVNRGNLLLALHMGAGKTVTAICAVRQLRRQRQVSHGVVFAFKSTKWQWLREIAKADPRARVQVVDGDKRSRVAAITHADRYNYTIMHYQCLVNDWEEIKDHLPIDFVILDEITAIKSFKAVTSRRAKVLGKHTDVRIGLSGQPVENRPEELFSIMEFIDRDVLGSFHKFDRTFIVRDGMWGRPLKYRNLHLIQQRLGPAMYRKSREDIAEWLPEMIETEYPIPLDAQTMALHDRIKDDLSIAIDTAISAGVGGGFDVLAHYGRTDSSRHMLMGQVMSRLLAMRMLSSHPALLKISAEDFDTELSRRGSEYASALRSSGALDNLPAVHVKFEACLEQIREIVDEDPRHKVVVFSYFKPILTMLGGDLRRMNIPYTLLNGETPAQERDRRIVKFNTDPDCRVFLSSDAGAYGVDLNQGSHLICYDLPWSGGALAQRISRIDRTNSAFKSILISYMYGKDTIEQRMFNMLQQKRKVARAFLDGEFDARSGGISLDLQSLREFLDS